MMWLKNLAGVLCFRTPALRALADRQAVLAGLVCYVAGYLAYALVRVYVSTPKAMALSPGGLFYAFWDADIVRWLLFLLFLYVPALVALSNAFSDDGLGFSFSITEYRAHLSVLLPVWGVVLLVTLPLQRLIPSPLSIDQSGNEVIANVFVGYLILPLLLAVYSVWVVRQLNYLSFARVLGVFALSLLALPVYAILSLFVMSLPFLFLIPLIYWGMGWVRSLGIAKTGAGGLQRNLQTLTVNPQDADAHYQLGLIHLNRGDVSDARGYFETAAKITPDVAEYHYYFGRACERKGDWGKALECYSEAYRLEPEYGQGDIFREVGKAYLNTGGVEKGKEFLNFFLARRDADPEGRYWLALALQKSGDAEGMRFQLSRIIEQARANPRFFRKQNREWISRARNLLRETT